MSFQWPVDAQGLFGERYPQMLNTGLPAVDVDAVRAAVTEMWPDGPGGWVYEWSALGARYAGQGAHNLAALAYGWAKFPTMADEAKRRAQQHQLDEYLLAAPDFEVDFERKVLELPYQRGSTTVPAHVFAAPDLPAGVPVVLASGGTDSWKMDMHGVFVLLATRFGVRVVAFDVPGTGESSVPFTAQGGEQIMRGLIAEARSLGNGTVVHLGISFGGFLSARTGLAGEVDGAIVLGGPVEAAWKKAEWKCGMNGIVGNMLGFDALPVVDELTHVLHDFSLRPLLNQDLNAPMLVVNGADDVHVPRADTLVFEGRRDTEVHLIRDTGHCATTKFPEATGYIFSWLERTLDNLAAKVTS
ncbi:alpha/beta hydrolase [Mycolicibacterium sp. CBMA 226]|uniref:alpha/beta hydrolase n=1 Tax=Mycolicibacterium sp. CBMA 226 TaxID=2606611 RepID=UPI0012DBDE5D|nr:alpha/beta hydrolase [Mycolicibacterium sp. CBMA 226]MUL79025.1 alpha/beta hydrolase [Mycolicibacterium sp. CBMA 226]QGW61346.1 Esterase FrsA [Mycolicibacterium sp.]